MSVRYALSPETVSGEGRSGVSGETAAAGPQVTEADRHQRVL